MSNTTVPSDGVSLKIVHVLRSPVGGLFRHVVDLVRMQAGRGHRIGLVADSSSGGPRADQALADLRPHLALGLARLPMRRDPHPFDAMALARIVRLVRAAAPDILHGHGAKGALYGRLAGLVPGRRPAPLTVYTPHGGSLHYDPRSLKGALILGMERRLIRATDLILFESQYAADRFRSAIGVPDCPVRVVHNGLRLEEFRPVAARPDAADFVYVGEMRHLKGVDLLLAGLAALGPRLGRPARAVLVGVGPDREAFEALALGLGLGESVTFKAAMPAREAFALGRVLVVPSRAESLPYIVLEAVAAQVPIVATRVGGIPEIFGTDAGLVPPDDVAALTEAMAARLAAATTGPHAATAALGRFVETRFAVDAMTDAVLAAYDDAIAHRRGADQPDPTRAGGPGLLELAGR